MDPSSEALVSVLRSFRAVYDEEHQKLSPAEREHGWIDYWASINTQLNYNPSQQYGTSIPQKRSASSAMVFGLEPAPKRPGHVCTLAVVYPSFLV